MDAPTSVWKGLVLASRAGQRVTLVDGAAEIIKDKPHGQDATEEQAVFRREDGGPVTVKLCSHQGQVSRGTETHKRVRLRLSTAAAVVKLTRILDASDETLSAELSCCARLDLSRAKWEDKREFAAWLVERGIDSISLNPDAVAATTAHILDVERQLQEAAPEPEES